MADSGIKSYWIAAVVFSVLLIVIGVISFVMSSPPNKNDDQIVDAQTQLDGRVVKVNNRADQVHLNLGSLDGLKIKQNFLVYDRDETNFESATAKAKIEVIRVTGPHMAVARIHERQVGNPILSDDHILSPTWDPGFKVPIAVAGFIDLDGDGKSDRLRFEGLVRQNGGVIVAQHDEAGNRRGDIDSNTRFLVVGDTPKEGENMAAVVKAMTFYDRQANDFNVQKMSVRRFLNWMAVPQN